MVTTENIQIHTHLIYMGKYLSKIRTQNNVPACGMVSLLSFKDQLHLIKGVICHQYVGCSNLLLYFILLLAEPNEIIARLT